MGVQDTPRTVAQAVPITLSIAGLLLLWFVTQHILILHSILTLTDLAVHPDTPTQLRAYLTALISHWSVTHLVGNLLGLVVVGTYVELRTDAHTVLTLFIITGFMTFVSYIAACSAVLSCGYFMGASIGIFGLYGAAPFVSVGHPRDSWLRTLRLVTAVVSVLLVSRELLNLLAGNWIPAIFHVIGAFSGICILIALQLVAVS